MLYAKKAIFNAKTMDTLTRKSIGPFADFSYKMAIFKRLEKYLDLTQIPSFVHQLVILTGNTSQCILVQKFSAVQNIPAFEIRGFHFYLIKWPFFNIFNFDSS